MRITDNWGNRISMSHTTWAAIMEYCSNIEQVQSTLEATAGDSWSYYRNCKNTKQKCSKIYIARYFYIHEAFNCAFYFERCVKNALRSIWQNLFKVGAKFKEFMTILRQNCINNKCDASKKFCKVYNKTSLIECKLVMYALNEIVDTAIYFKK